MSLLSIKRINLLFLLFSYSLLVTYCSNDDVQLNNTFRDKYNGTCWQWDGGVIKFSTDKLFYIVEGNAICNGEDSDCCDDNIKCYFYEEGSFDNVNCNGCIYDNFSYHLIEEESDKLVFREIRSSGEPINSNLAPTQGFEITVTFTELNQREINMKYESPHGVLTYVLSKSDSQFSSSSCLNGLLSGRTVF